MGFPPCQATIVSSYIHTPPSGFGKIMAEVKPRLAVAYHTIRQPEQDLMMIEASERMEAQSPDRLRHRPV